MLLVLDACPISLVPPHLFPLSVSLIHVESLSLPMTLPLVPIFAILLHISMLYVYSVNVIDFQSVYFKKDKFCWFEKLKKHRKEEIDEEVLNQCFSNASFVAPFYS